MGRQLLLVLLLAVAAVACHRYQPYTPREVVFATQQAAFDGAVDVLVRNSYPIVLRDDERGILQTEAKLDQGRRVSLITLRAYPDGILRVDASGEHFRGQEHAHRKLLAELDLLQELLARQSWYQSEHATHTAQR